MTNESNTIGARMRDRRVSLGYSLRDLAARTDLTASFLSQVERGEANTSIDSLRRISEALDVSMLHFLREVHEHDPVVRANERAILSLPNSNLTYELLTSGLTHKLQVFIGKVDGRTENFARRLREPTEEVIYVLNGTLTVGLDSGEHELHTGDSICFEGYQLKSLSTGGEDEETSWISVITPPAF